jgi:hypothetical protein
MLQKFAELPVGQPFVFEGEGYVKSSPLMGRAESGRERLIPRSAMVETGTPAPAPRPAPERTLPAAEVRRALRAFAARIDGVAAALEARGDGASADEVRRAAADLERELGLNSGE